MKKTYICPKTEITVLHAESMLASSIGIYESDADQLTNRKDWESPIWGTDEEGVEE